LEPGCRLGGDGERAFSHSEPLARPFCGRREGEQESHTRSWGNLTSTSGQPLKSSRDSHCPRPRLQISCPRVSRAQSPRMKVRGRGRGLAAGGLWTWGDPRTHRRPVPTVLQRPPRSTPSRSFWGTAGLLRIWWSPPLARLDSSSCDSVPRDQTWVFVLMWVFLLVFFFFGTGT
jgi:hypothetical protein